MTIEERLHEMGYEVPALAGPPPGVRINFVATRRSGNQLYLSGNGPLRDGSLVYSGKLGKDVTVEEGYDAARLTALNLLAVTKQELGSLDRVTAWVKVLGFINSAPGFYDQPSVLNGFSDFIIELYGQERGTHARSAVGMAELPWNIPVEIEAIVEFE